jgi:glycosyltransferase involved in cell wall biosynthesis
MPAQPTVSLLVPCFNAASYISDFIKNMSRQTRPFDEVLFYDDASTDGTVELLRQQNFGRVIYGKLNQGPSVGRNILLRESTGQLIHFHDVDDWLEPTFLEETIQALSDEWDAVITNIRVIDRDTSKTRHIHDYSELIDNTDTTEFFLTHCCYPINGLYRRRVLEKIGGFRESLSRDEDPDLHIRLAHSGARIHSLPLPLAINRFGIGTYSSNSYISCWREHLKALQYYVKELPEKYYSILRSDSAHMVGLCAACGDLQLAHNYLDFCESIGGQKELALATSGPMKLLIPILGYRNALNLRFGSIGIRIRKIWPWRIG